MLNVSPCQRWSNKSIYKYLALSASAINADANGAAALVPECSVVQHGGLGHFILISVVAYI